MSGAGPERFSHQDTGFQSNNVKNNGMADTARVYLRRTQITLLCVAERCLKEAGTVLMCRGWESTRTAWLDMGRSYFGHCRPVSHLGLGQFDQGGVTRHRDGVRRSCANIGNFGGSGLSAPSSAHTQVRVIKEVDLFAFGTKSLHRMGSTARC
jgi:hypothetical protein